MKKTIALLLTLVMLLALTGCGTAQPAATAAPAETAPQAASQETTVPGEDYPIAELRIGTTAAIEKAVRDEYNFDMLASGVSEPPLVYQDLEGQYHPLVASYETQDGLSWTFTILEGMTWSDGQPVTADDILFTLQYNQDHGSAIFEDQVNDKGKTVKALYTSAEVSEDHQSITLTLNAPNIRALSNMTSFRVMPKHIYEGKDTVTEAEARIGCGPYVFESFNPQAGTISFTASETYPQKPHVKTIIYQMFGNEDTMYLALQQGDIDMVWNYSSGVPSTYQSVLAADSRVSLVNVPASNAPAVLAFNNSKGLFADENLRQAVSYALNYDDFKAYFGSEYAQVPGRGFVPTTTVGYIPTDSLTHDELKAAEFMKAAGYEKKDDKGIYVDSAGKQAQFTLTVNAAKETHVGYAELIKTQLEQFGILVNLETLDKDSYNAKTSNKFSENNITMEAAIYGYTAAGMGMGNGLASIYVDGTHPVQGGCQVLDPAFQEIMESLKAAVSLEQYGEAAAQLQTYYADHVPLLALYWDNMMLAHSSNLQNVTVDAVFGLNNIQNFLTITEN